MESEECSAKAPPQARRLSGFFVLDRITQRMYTCQKINRRNKMQTERKPRPIRMDDIEWEAFRSLLGATWLRKQIDRAIKKDQRKPTVKPVEE